MERKIRVGAVSYMNAKPLLYGLQFPEMEQSIDLCLDYPSNLVGLLKSGTIDVGLVPVASLKIFDSYHIIGKHCIAADGKVASVALFSQVPLSQISRVVLDYQSKTSVELCKILFRQHWKREVEFIPAADEDYLSKMKDDTACLVIGDRALKLLGKVNFVYDLAEAWKEMTGLPFVFALWLSLRPIPEAFIKDFDEANELGLKALPKVLEQLHFEEYDLKTYFTENIHYSLTPEMRDAIALFLSLIGNI